MLALLETVTPAALKAGFARPLMSGTDCEPSVKKMARKKGLEKHKRQTLKEAQENLLKTVRLQERWTMTMTTTA